MPVNHKNDLMTPLVILKHIKGKLKCTNCREFEENRYYSTSRKRLRHSGLGNIQTSFLPKKR